VFSQGLNLLLFAGRRFEQGSEQGGGQGGLTRVTLAGATDTGKAPGPSISEPACLPVCLSSLLGTSLATLHSTPVTPVTPFHSLDGDGTPHAPCPQTCGQRHFGIYRLNCDFGDH
jgi:hypothetical protein